MKRFPTLLCCIALAAASVFPLGADDAAIDFRTLLPGSSGEPVTSIEPMPFPARGGDVDWGLALSGGGLRSAAFSIGAMKALYDIGLLDDIDVISSVSGGGYASYWLYSRYDGRDSTRFGDGAFHPQVFPSNVCTLGGKSEFFPLSRMIRAVFSSRDKAFSKYRDAIEWSFGVEDGRSREAKRKAGIVALRRLQTLTPQIAAAQAPYFILNTTIENGRTKGGKIEEAIDKSFEIGPTYRGSRRLKFADWPAGEGSIRTWCDGVAMSGAAVRFKLSRTIPNYSAEIEGVEIDLAD
ncbi:MAG TPA: patatin-like phospholipase family protein, partial [Pyrinomonadaceae bacterium]